MNSSEITVTTRKNHNIHMENGDFLKVFKEMKALEAEYSKYSKEDIVDYMVVNEILSHDPYFENKRAYTIGVLSRIANKFESMNPDAEGIAMIQEARELAYLLRDGDNEETEQRQP